LTASRISIKYSSLVLYAMRKQLTLAGAVASLVFFILSVSATLALVDTSGKYRIELCSRTWPGCSKAPEFIGFNNKTCVAGVPPVSNVYGDTVGPLLRGSKTSSNWRTWVVDVVSKKADRTIVTIKNDYSAARCSDHYIDDYSEKKDACKGTAWADRVHMHKFPGQWTVKPAKGTNGKCFNIVNAEKPLGCLRYLSANSDCKERHLKLVETDDGSGLQQWRFVKVGGSTSPSSPSSPLPGSTCVSTGPNNCSGCCKTKFEKMDGSFLEDESCVDVAEYPQCDFETSPPPSPSSPPSSRSSPKIVSTASGSPTAGKVVFEPEAGAVECTVKATPKGGVPAVTATVGHPISYPTTSVNLHNLNPDSVYEITVKCTGEDGKEEQASNQKELHTVPTDAHPGIVNLHPTSSTSAGFHVVRPDPSQCDAEKYDVYYGKQGSSAKKTSVSSVDVSLTGLSPDTKYEITVDAICKGGQVTKKSSPSFVTTPSSIPPPTPSPNPSPNPQPSPQPPSPTQIPSTLTLAPTFHTISVYGPHPEVSLFLNGTVPTGTSTVVDVDCTNGFKTTASVPASAPETDLHLPVGLPTDATCTFTGYTTDGSKKSPVATETRVTPTTMMEAPTLVNWTPDFKKGGGSVVVVAPQVVNCTGGIVEYTVTGREAAGSSLVGRRRKLLQNRGSFTVTTSTPGTVVVPDGSLIYGDSGTNPVNMEVVGKCSDGSLTPTGHLSVSLQQCPAVPNCKPYRLSEYGKCRCAECNPGYILSQDGYSCTGVPPPPPPPPALLPPPPPPAPSGPCTTADLSATTDWALGCGPTSCDSVCSGFGKPCTVAGMLNVDTKAKGIFVLDLFNIPVTSYYGWPDAGNDVPAVDYYSPTRSEFVWNGRGAPSKCDAKGNYPVSRRLCCCGANCPVQ
jgi:hypothetical protein